MKYSDHFREVTKRRFIRLAAGGALAGIALDLILFVAGVPEKMPFVLLGVIIILLIALMDWLDFHVGIFGKL